MSWRGDRIDNEALRAIGRIVQSIQEEAEKRVVSAHLERDIKEPQRQGSLGGGSGSQFRHDPIHSPDADAAIREALS